MGVQIIIAVQSIANPVLDFIANLVTLFCEPPVLFVITFAIYWCLDKRRGQRIILTLVFSLGLNNLLKDIIKAPRPIGEPGVMSNRVETATGDSFPSGHSQASSAFYGSLVPGAARWLRVIFIALPFLVALSRIYFGVHYPRDTVAGLILGFATAAMFTLLIDRVRIDKLLRFCLPVAVLMALPLMFSDSNDSVRSAGALLGSVLGVWCEVRSVNFLPCKGLRQAVKRFLLGVISTAAIYFAFELLPQNSLIMFAGFFGLTLWGTYLYPLLIKKLKL